MEALPSVMFVFLVNGLTFATLIFVAENALPNINDVPGARIYNFQSSIWFALIAMTTVGFGDRFPQTYIGQILTGFLVVFQVLYMAVPIGILGNEFTDVWVQRHFILAQWRLLSRVQNYSIQHEDVLGLCSMAADADDKLNFRAFEQVCIAMGLKLQHLELKALFKRLDVKQELVISTTIFPDFIFNDTTDDIAHREYVLESRMKALAGQQNGRLSLSSM